MKNIKKTFLIFIIFVLFIGYKAYGRYKYVYIVPAFSFTIEKTNEDKKAIEYSLLDFNYDITSANNDSIKVNVKAFPKETIKFKYYINDSLKGTSKDNEFLFSNLEKGKNYKIKIEALDSNDIVIDTKEKSIKIIVFSN